MKIDSDIIIEMITRQLIDNDMRKNEKDPWSDQDLYKIWNSYPMSVDDYVIESDKIFIRYKVKIGESESIQLIRIDKAEYIRRVSYKESYERDKKLEEILRPKKPSIFERIKNYF